MNRKVFCIILFLFIPVLSFAEIPHSNEKLELLKKECVEFVSKGWEGYTVCESFSVRDDKKAFLEKTLGKKLIEKSIDIASKELFINQLHPVEDRFHLGMISVKYEDSRIATANYTALLTYKSEYLSGRKILTRFIPLLRGEYLIILFSEYSAHPKIKALFSKKKMSK